MADIPDGSSNPPPPSTGQESGDSASSATTTGAKERADFLQKMYVQMFDDIKVQLQVVWQAVAVVAGTFGILSLVEKRVISLDWAVALVLVVCAWLLGHVIEASYWYNRNLAIIANIERQFLTKADLRDIHYYFGRHRRIGSMIYHLRLQFAFGVLIAGIVLWWHFTERVWPGLHSPMSHFEPLRCAPYAVVAVGAALLWRFHDDNARKYAEFLKNSPGKEIEPSGITYGIGHPSHTK